jgi:hypothetical protein
MPLGLPLSKFSSLHTLGKINRSNALDIPALAPMWGEKSGANGLCKTAISASDGKLLLLIALQIVCRDLSTPILMPDGGLLGHPLSRFGVVRRK